MAAGSLSRDDLALGRAVLLATDSLDMAVEGAFWLHDSTDNSWRYFLVTSLSDRIGSREIYFRLNDALSKILSEAEAKEFAFYIATPKDDLVRKLRSRIKTAARASFPEEVPVDVQGRRELAIVYRLASGINDTEARRAQRRFGRRYRELATA